MQTSSSTFGRRGAAAGPAPRSSRPEPASPRPAKATSGLAWLLFSYQGRCRRLHYWLGRLGLTVAYFAALITLRGVMPKPGTVTAATALTTAILALILLVLMLAVIVTFMWALFAIDVKRCHDRNKTGWFALISLVPILSLWTFVELGCLDGAPSENRFGPSPKGVDAAVFS